MAGMGGSGGGPRGSFHTGNLREQASHPRDSYELPHVGMSQAMYANQLDVEERDAAAGKGPGVVERFKRWFSARF